MIVKASPFNLDRLQREVNILLISDLHYDVRREKQHSKWMRGRVVNERLVASLPAEPDAWAPDILIVAGDLVNQNKPGNYKHYIDLIKKLTNRFPNLRNAYFSTPGNHDINREHLVSVFSYLYQLQEKDPAHKMEDSFTNNPVVDTIYTTAKESITENASLLNSLAAFEKAYFRTYLSEKDNLQKRKIIDEVTVDPVYKSIKTVYYRSILGITLASLNSSFFCNLSQTGQDRNNLFLICSIIDQLNIKLRSQSGPVVTFMHHPYYYLHESEHIAPASGNTNSEKQNNFTKLVKVSDLILSGHVHGDLQDPTYLQHHAYMITNGASYTTDLFEGKCYPYTYALIKINKQLGKFSMKKFKYEPQEGTTGPAYAYTCENDEERFYKFRQRDKKELTTLETEKIRVLRYFKDCQPEYAKIAEDCSYHIFQLRLYDHRLAQTTNDYDFKREHIPDHDCHLHKISHQNATIWIYVLEGKKFLLDIEAILSTQASTFPENCTIYFSIDMDELCDNETPSKVKIEFSRKTYEALVLAEKIENVSLTLLYH